MGGPEWVLGGGLTALKAHKGCGYTAGMPARSGPISSQQLELRSAQEALAWFSLWTDRRGLDDVKTDNISARPSLGHAGGVLVMSAVLWLPLSTSTDS